MRKLIISALNGVPFEEHAELLKNHGNLEVIHDRKTTRVVTLEQQLDRLKEDFNRAATQAEQLLERLRIAETRLEGAELERANASEGWTKEKAEHHKALDLINSLIAERDEMANKATEYERKFGERDAWANELEERLQFIDGEDEIDRLELKVIELNNLIAKEHVSKPVRQRKAKVSA